MTQNTSHAVMQQRHEAHDSLDDFPTPPWAVRAIIRQFMYEHANIRGLIWEPTCNRGYMVRPLREQYPNVLATDIHDYGWEGQDRVCDFLFEPKPEGLEWVVFNPPFRLAAEFILHALSMKPIGVIAIVRTSFLEGGERYRTLFERTPPSIVAQFVERVPMVKGRHDPEASTATSYACLVWLDGAPRKTRFEWIAPCRREFQQAEDAVLPQSKFESPQRPRPQLSGQRVRSPNPASGRVSGGASTE